MTQHEHPDDQLAVYAVDALEPEERERVTQHLATCTRCQAELDRHREILARLVPDETTPPAVWERLAAGLEPAGGVEPAGDGGRLPSLAPRLPADGLRRAARPQPRLVWLAAAAVALVALAIGVLLVGRRPADLASLAEAAFDNAGNTIASLTDDEGEVLVRIAVAADGSAYVDLDDLPELSPGRTYQLWSVAGPEPVSVGILGNGRTPTVALHLPSAPTELVLTEEPAGGSRNPTGRVVASGELALVVEPLN